MSRRTKLSATTVVLTAAGALLCLGAGTATAADWPDLIPGAYLYAGPNGTGTVTTVDTGDYGTCHTLSEPAVSEQVASGSAALELFRGADCTGQSWATSSLSQANLPWSALSYRVRHP
ncbi:hypothetical protein ACIQZB_40595 [Streptomyces sp. NPDC097727]|uniref:hypothetical protein n=1 Tax=Streptomyces sp. NPDC097727 TaxID=3366092 RepID=UPI0037FC0099